MCRRSLNIVTAVSGPLLFEVNQSLPYFVAFSLNTAWAIVLLITFKHREAKIMEKIESIEVLRKIGLNSTMKYDMKEIMA